MANTGYWMPFDAAKAVAATFCWKIRYALTPVFGPDFPKMCLRPEAEGFGTMIIDLAVTQRCTEQAGFYRQLETNALSGVATAFRSPLTPESPTIPRHVKELRPKARQSARSGSGYDSDSSFAGSYMATSVSPTIPYCNTWTPANTPRSVGPALHDRLPSPQDVLAGTSAEAAEEDRNSAHSASTSSTTSLLLRSRQEPHEGRDHGDGTRTPLPYEIAQDVVAETDGTWGRPSDIPVLSDEKAAYLLLKLSMEAAVSEAPRREKRRAST